jgi:hypothetical protein
MELLTDAQVAALATQDELETWNHTVCGLDVDDVLAVLAAEVQQARGRRCGGCDSYEDPHYCLLWSIRPAPDHFCADFTLKVDATP